MRALTILLVMTFMCHFALADEFILAHQKISWKRVQRGSVEAFVIDVQGFRGVLAQGGAGGGLHALDQIEVYKPDGTLWAPLDLARAVEQNNGRHPQMSPSQPPFAYVSNGTLHYELTPVYLDSLVDLAETFSNGPILIALRKPLVSYLSDNFAAFRDMYLKSNLPGSSPLNGFKRFMFESMLDGDFTSEVMQQYPPHIRGAIYELGLTESRFSLFVDQLVGRPLPVSRLRKSYYNRSEAQRPSPTGAALIVVHPMSQFHESASLIRSLNEVMVSFRAQHIPMFTLLAHDGLGDASVFAKTDPTDHLVYSPEGSHVLCENCTDVTFLGGHLTQCLSTAIANYIANYFTAHRTGTVRVNLPMDGIYSNSTIGNFDRKTSSFQLAEEVERVGLIAVAEDFVSKLLDVSGDQAIKLLPTQNSSKEVDLTPTRIVDLFSRTFPDKPGNFRFPYLPDAHFLIRFQRNGREFARPIGSGGGEKTIIFNFI